MFDDVRVEVVGMKRSCPVYHKAVGQVFDVSQFVPKGLCVEAFHAAYPFCLGLLYGATYERDEAGQAICHTYCPRGKAGIRLRISTAPLTSFNHVIRNLLKKILRTVCGYHIDVVERKVVLRVVEGRCSTCPHEIGETFEFNIGGKSELCPAAFNSIFPHLKGARTQSAVTISCPDSRTQIQFKITKK